MDPPPGMGFVELGTRVHSFLAAARTGRVCPDCAGNRLRAEDCPTCQGTFVMPNVLEQLSEIEEG